MTDAQIRVTGLAPWGHGLARPEDLAVTSDQRVFASDANAAVSEILPDGSIRPIGVAGGEPNGINLTADESHMFIANAGTHALQLVDLDSGEVRTFCDRVGDLPFSNANYPAVADDGAVYCSVSTQMDDFQMSIVEGCDDGVIVRVDESGHAEVVADGLKFPNCMAFDAGKEFLYCAQTSGCDVVRFAVNSDGSLGKTEQYGPPLGDRDVYGDEAVHAVWGDQEIRNFETADLSVFYAWGGVDGCAFDAQGNLWVTRATRGDLVAISPELGLLEITCEGEALLMPTSVTFGGEDMRDVYIGTLFMPHVLKGRSSVPGPRV